jgi:hypothetical protein
MLGLGAAAAAGGGVDGGPVRAVGRGLDLERGGVGGLPLERDLADALRRAEVDLQPLRVGERAGPPGAGVAVHRRRGRERRVLGGRRGRRLVQRQVGGGSGCWTASGPGSAGPMSGSRTPSPPNWRRTRPYARRTRCCSPCRTSSAWPTTRASWAPSRVISRPPSAGPRPWRRGA